MVREASSDVEDVGRKESEKQLRSNRTKYLDDVLEQVDTDYDDIAAMIEERRAAEQKDDGFIDAIDAILADGAQSDTTQESINSVHSLLSAVDSLIQLNKNANHAISASSAGATGSAAYAQARTEDQERVKQILAAGKRVFEGELEEVTQQARAEQASGKGGSAQQAIHIFGDGTEKVGRNAEASKTLAYLERGVKKMTKGLEGPA